MPVPDTELTQEISKAIESDKGELLTMDDLTPAISRHLFNLGFPLPWYDICLNKNISEEWFKNGGEALWDGFQDYQVKVKLKSEYLTRKFAIDCLTIPIKELHAFLIEAEKIPGWQPIDSDGCPITVSACCHDPKDV
jgi:hypothetical protein